MKLLRNLYYEFKPYLPTAARMAFRRGLARRVLARSKDVWPINPKAGIKPEGWAGWPQGKRFALILTHDVEGSIGLSRCRALADLEEAFGFRSSFNFVPEGEYSTPKELRSELESRGFEIGVHDLRHDGKLYRSHVEFRKAAVRINSYLQAWGVTGFRSGFMHHNLDWLHELEISYDMSTFDTDPFEPQPDGVDTIFPFWVSAPNGPAGRSGYVEMPYTLPQDSTLFLLLQHRDVDVWKRKLDWIVENEGMALINVHPDYMCFDNQASTSFYPASLYQDFLKYVREKYLGQYWHALPCEVSDLVRGRKGLGVPRSGGSGEEGVLVTASAAI